MHKNHNIQGPSPQILVTHTIFPSKFLLWLEALLTRTNKYQGVVKFIQKHTFLGFVVLELLLAMEESTLIINHYK